MRVCALACVRVCVCERERERKEGGVRGRERMKGGSAYPQNDRKVASTHTARLHVCVLTCAAACVCHASLQVNATLDEVAGCAEANYRLMAAVRTAGSKLSGPERKRAAELLHGIAVGMRWLRCACLRRGGGWGLSCCMGSRCA